MEPKTIKIKCKLCRKEIEIIVLDSDYNEWLKTKEDASNAFPYISIGERTIIEKGVCVDCL